MLSRLQRGLEKLYRVETSLAVEEFVIDAQTCARFGLARAPKEQLLVAHSNGELELGLFVDQRALRNLELHDPGRRLDGTNLDDFVLTIEGVSHFVYLAWRAQADHRVSALELELQAEVDKYVTCVLTLEDAGDVQPRLRHLLFDCVVFDPSLDGTERERYQVANENARRYSASLERRFVAARRLPAMLAELRRFYRLPLTGKLALIRAAA